jgi:hypothetical protein
MHDPQCVAHEIRYPWRKWPNAKGKWESQYRASFVTIWHVDPETDGSDDSCGWFIRGRHLSQADRDHAKDLITNEYDNLRHWFTGRDDEEKIGQLLGCFAALRRREQPWYKHARWHVWHWKLQIHPWQQFRRWLLTRCALCGKRIVGESPVSHSWASPKPTFMRGEVGLYHSACSNMAVERTKATVQ